MADEILGGKWTLDTTDLKAGITAAVVGVILNLALYFAAHRWGNGQGIYNYQAEADALVDEALGG